MDIRTFVCILLIFSTLKGLTIGEHIPAGGRSSATGGTSVAISDFWSISNNQAGMAWLKGLNAGGCVENRFLLKELMYQQIGVVFGSKAGTFGVLVNRFGNSHYNEIKAGLSFARKFSKHFAFGIQLDYMRINTQNDYGSKNLVSCEIGLMYHSDQHLNIGVQLLNPVPIKITEHPVEYLPAIICIGLSYRFSEVFMTSIEAEKDLQHKAIFRVGAEYKFTKILSARIGISTNPMSFTFGFGLESGKLKMDIASEYHQVLGFSPSVSIVYQFIQK